MIRILRSKKNSEEIIQDIFIKIWNSIHLYDSSKGRFYTWLINIARDTSIHYLNSKSFQNGFENLPVRDFVYSHEKLSSEIVKFNHVFKNLKADQQELIDWVYYQGYTLDEISKKLKLPPGIVKTRIHSILIELKDELKDYQ